MMNAPIVEVEGLQKRFGSVTALEQISFTLREQEFFSLLGPSGCGKTTTLRCVAGLESADQGRIRIGGQTVFDADRRIDIPPNHRAIGMVFQSYAVWPHMRVFDNIAYPLKVQGLPRCQIQTRVAEVLALLGMPDLSQRMPSQLSGGQQQRVALGRALALRPSVLLLDEPLSNLDAKLREQMRVELKLIQKESGLPILYVTHDQTEALALSDRIAVMHGGHIHQLDSPQAIYQHPATQFVLDFIGTVNYLPCRIEAQDGDQVQLRFSDGQGYVLPCPSYIPDSRDVLLAIRPEDIAFSIDLQAPGLEAIVEWCSFLGYAHGYHLRLDNHILRLQGAKHRPLQEGQPVRLQLRSGLLLAPDALHNPLARAS